MVEVEDKLDMLNFREDKSVIKSLDPKGKSLTKLESILLSCAVFKFNDHKKKQERNIMVTLKGVYNMKGDSKLWEYSAIRRKIDIEKIKAITVSRIGTEFVLHVPDEYDYRYASEKRDKIIYCILKASGLITKEKMPIYTKDELSLVNVVNTKEDKKKKGIKDLTGELQVIFFI